MSYNKAHIKITPFQKRVYDAIVDIPAGKVSTYKILAEYMYLGCKSSQAVGQALKRNPFAPEVPCHRIIKSDLSMGGYGGKFDDKKEIRLKSEGVMIEDGKLCDVSQLYHF